MTDEIAKLKAILSEQINDIQYVEICYDDLVGSINTCKDMLSEIETTFRILDTFISKFEPGVSIFRFVKCRSGRGGAGGR